MNRWLILVAFLLAGFTVGCDRADLDALLGAERTEAAEDAIDGALDDREGAPTNEDEDEDDPERVVEDDNEADDQRPGLEDEAVENGDDDEDRDWASNGRDDEESDGQGQETDGDELEDAVETEPSSDSSVDQVRIQAIGDSHLAFNGDRSTADQIRDVLRERGVDVELQNNAVGGATLGCGERGIGSPDNCIPPQLENGPWSHVVLSGGGNDFLESQCGVDVDALISPRLDAGLMVQLVDQIRQSGASVIIVGYVSPLDPDGEAGGCEPIKTLLSRYQRFSAETQGVTYVDTWAVFGPDQRSMYADDIHTSVDGSRRLAEVIADTILP